MHAMESLHQQVAGWIEKVRNLKDKLSEVEAERDRLTEEVARLKLDNARLEDMAWESRE